MKLEHYIAHVYELISIARGSFLVSHSRERHRRLLAFHCDYVNLHLLHGKNTQPSSKQNTSIKKRAQNGLTNFAGGIHINKNKRGENVDEISNFHFNKLCLFVSSVRLFFCIVWFWQLEFPRNFPNEKGGICGMFIINRSIARNSNDSHLGDFFNRI